MPKQTTHVNVVRQWCQSLGVLSAVSISREEAELKLRAYVPMLMDRFPDGAFTTASLEHVARNAVKGFPTYGELAAWLSDWWMQHRPLPPLLNGPAKEAPPPAPREPPTEEEVAYVRARVQEIVGNMHSPFSETRVDTPARQPRPAYASPELLDQINPLPNGVKRVRMELVK
jgi:hypothetical protein